MARIPVAGPSITKKEIDYVTIATPEHWHSRMTIDALDAGKAVYCEKPMTHSIPEAKEVLKKQKSTGLAVQVGVQAMSDDSYSSAAKAIEEGVLGQVVQAQIEYVRRYDKAGPWRNPTLDPKMPKPDDLDWNAWLGPAPVKRYNKNRSFYRFRWFYDYSGGQLTNFGVHYIASIHWALGVQAPTAVSSAS